MTDKVRIGARRIGHARDDGFTLIESLTAAAILLVIAGAVVTTLVATASWYSDARLRTESASVANKVMALVLARNSSEIVITPGGKFASQIVDRMPYGSAVGTFTVLTSIDPTTTGGVDTTRVVVTAFPENDPIDPATTFGRHAASVVRYAGGWQTTGTQAGAGQVVVTVDIKVADRTPGSENWYGESSTREFSGVRVQLLGADPTKPETYMKEIYYAVTDQYGTATFGTSSAPIVDEGAYFVTCDSRFGPDLRPSYFPRREYVAVGAANHVDLQVVRSVNTALLRIGAFQGDGFTYAGTKLYYPVPLQPAFGRKVTVEPNFPAGDSTYPDKSKVDFKFSSTVNAFGVACIEVPYSMESGLTWTATLYKKDGVTVDKTMTDYASGSWPDKFDSTGSRYSRIDLPAGQDLPQWVSLGN